MLDPAVRRVLDSPDQVRVVAVIDPEHQSIGLG
ncbi:hypothetical protein FB561_0163 [Kribbella amoyensis]|uniref:Uncharacterized protein n=1 Tax=Kribbella amoyensis TaxID=996641 RepID=A0A561BJQ4_9ACTN|nr:hypothetical protein FB561_0163 [Kribbella amoyensis]